MEMSTNSTMMSKHDYNLYVVMKLWNMNKTGIRADEKLGVVGDDKLHGLSYGNPLLR